MNLNTVITVYDNGTRNQLIKVVGIFTDYEAALTTFEIKCNECSADKWVRDKSVGGGGDQRLYRKGEESITVKISSRNMSFSLVAS